MLKLRWRWWMGAVVAVGLVTAGCGSSSSKESSTTTASSKTAATGKITVSAAASLTEAFDKLAKDFEAANPRGTVVFNFGSSTTLATQIQQGAPADALASADQANMTKLVSAHLVDGTPATFARNKLVVVTKPGNPKHVETLADLPKLGTIALCGADVPCGKYAEQVLQNSHVTIPTSKITRGQDVKATLAAVTTGDADAAIVYATDAMSAGNTVTTVEIPDSQNAIAVYPIGVITKSSNKATARAFTAYLTSPAGQATLKSFGFLPPS